MYSFKEVLELFKLSYTVTIEDLKRAKMQVLKMHPDKSRLPPDYFLFYKKAFDIILDYYNENQKINIAVPHDEIVYNTETETEFKRDKTTSKKIDKTMKEMGREKFQEKFNELFEQNMANKPDESINDWFKDNNPLYQYDEIKSTSNLGKAFDSIKEKTASLVQYKGVENLNSTMGNNLYEESDHHYVSCDPFGKLKFDDLRKVHKDQTIFAVGERDFSKVQQYTSMDHLQRERGAMNLKPLEKTQAEQILKEREDILKKQMLTKQHNANLKTMEYSEKNKSVMAHFFQLMN